MTGKLAQFWENWKELNWSNRTEKEFFERFQINNQNDIFPFLWLFNFLAFFSKNIKYIDPSSHCFLILCS